MGYLGSRLSDMLRSLLSMLPSMSYLRSMASQIMPYSPTGPLVSDGEYYTTRSSHYNFPNLILNRLAAGNMALVVFLALKNTPLAFLTAYSYERLNGLHQIAGYTAFLEAFMHGVMYVTYFAKQGRWDELHLDIVIVAYPLLAALVITALAGLILRHLNYETFYIVHVLCFIVIIITLGLHRPLINPERILIVTLLMASLWVSDRLIRFSRLVYNSINNTAAVYPLSDGGTRIVFKKPLSRARPGKHCYVWLPQIRAFETHPFTIVSTDPLELVSNSAYLVYF